MKTHDFYYDLPKELIAQTPLADRSASRLMVLDKQTGQIEHKYFKDIIDYLNPEDCLVINDTKVIPARLNGLKPTGGHVELLLLTRKEERVWETLARPGKRVRPGDIVEFGDGLLTAHIDSDLGEGRKLVTFEYEGIFEEILDKLGEMPLPPYIKEQLEDNNQYQTVYAERLGSAAAPTAGLHFTEELLRDIAAKGVAIARVTLHVGLGTFRPVKSEDILDHKMHSEYYEVTESQAAIMNERRKAGGHIVCTGTTSVRTLESVTDGEGVVHAQSGWTDIFIYPGYKFNAVDALITNFHLPESTLVMLVSALCSREMILHAYGVAVQERYRFFSFGDAMFIK